PGWDAVAVTAARAAMSGVDLPLTVDANGAYAWPDDEPSLRALDDLGLLYIEQPLAPDELVGHAVLGRALSTPVCLDETLTSAAVARHVIDLDGPRVWNIKVHRMGGLAEVCRVYAQAAAYQAELWVGTMPETGIGSQAALAVAGLPLCVYPSDLEPSSRWYGRDADVIKLTMSKDGRMAVPGVSAARPVSRWSHGGGDGLAVSAQPLLHRRQQRRRMADHGLRAHLDAAVRRPADRLDRRARGRPGRSQRHLRRQRRRAAAPGPLDR